MTKGRALHLVPVLACLGLLAGCGEHGGTPTSPEPLASVSAAQLSAPATAQPSLGGPPAGPPVAIAGASRGGGLPRRHRDGSTPERHGGAPPRDGASGGGTPGVVRLSLALQPALWDIDFSHTPGTVTAVVGGTGLASIDRGSIVLAGEAGTARPFRVQLAGDHLEALFTNADAIATLDAPFPHKRERVTLRLTANGAPQALDAFVVVVGKNIY
jgi:hypothetical protein